jgi:predicted ester cyclase
MQSLDMLPPVCSVPIERNNRMLTKDVILENKALIGKTFDLLNQGKAVEAAQFTHPECSLNGEPFGQQGDIMRMQMFVNAFPDQVWTWDRLIAEGDWVSAAYTFKGTFTGPLREYSPNGKEIMFTGVSVYHILDGKITEIWEYYDKLGLYQQMGLIPA